MLKFNFKDWIFHSAVICQQELCKRGGMMKTRLATDIDGYPFKVVRTESLTILIINNFVSCHLMVINVLHTDRTWKYIAKTEVEIFLTLVVSMVTV